MYNLIFSSSNKQIMRIKLKYLFKTIYKMICGSLLNL